LKEISLAPVGSELENVLNEKRKGEVLSVHMGGGVEVQLHAPLTSPLKISVSRPGCFISRGNAPPAPIAYETGWATERVWTLGREQAKPDLLCVPSAQRD